MVNFYQDQEFINDNLCIYRRPGAKNGRWQYRAYVGGKYYIKSTKVTDRRKAYDAAERAYKDLVRRHRAGHTLDRVLFRHQADKWIEVLEAEKISRKRTAILSPLQLYLKPYFGDMDVREIGEDQIDDYKDNRRTEFSPAPSVSTVNTELWVLRLFFKRLPKNIMEAKEKPLIANISLEKPPEGFKEQSDRRPFTRDELADIRRELTWKQITVVKTPLTFLQK
ncbi:hypothetical protein [Magnetovibrio blakemorei]|uniref:Integrase SAM-like N-terminal domain-containing protein n=1 Tax=Magnetovibrio blakemorei TaxID=28181 RepID=A0A1E5Q511_9PROT|nr:hypothetical protein [Magnetovibrio blakemorei]OEJ65378.1 hypothetical protein BEN30_14775 [Magnetovibrio blakemorei]